ncbi:hypothetical protein [Streptomyces filamentosus]|uniref:hypothetical protein n=1 Tax=Streptomyces filamentosus TaxID=67294 RepID=UPI0034082D25
MVSYRIRWTQDSREHTSAVAYDEHALPFYEQLKREQTDPRVSGVSHFQVKPGE